MTDDEKKILDLIEFCKVQSAANIKRARSSIHWRYGMAMFPALVNLPIACCDFYHLSYYGGIYSSCMALGITALSWCFASVAVTIARKSKKEWADLRLKAERQLAEYRTQLYGKNYNG